MVQLAVAAEQHDRSVEYIQFDLVPQQVAEVSHRLRQMDAADHQEGVGLFGQLEIIAHSHLGTLAGLHTKPAYTPGSAVRCRTPLAW